MEVRRLVLKTCRKLMQRHDLLGSVHQERVRYAYVFFWLRDRMGFLFDT